MPPGESGRHAAGARVSAVHLPWRSPAWSCVSKRITLVTRETKAKWVRVLFLWPSCLADEIVPERPRREHLKDKDSPDSCTMACDECDLGSSW